MTEQQGRQTGLQGTVDLPPDSLPFVALNKILEIQNLQLKLTESEAALERERDRATLLAHELDRLRLSSNPTQTSPCDPPSPLFDPTPENVSGISGAPRSPGERNDDLVAVPRASLELLFLKERAMDAVKEGITIADATQPEMPLIYANEGFTRITGYPTEFALGRNCRFLQGTGTDATTVDLLKSSIAAGQPCVVQITNYKRSGDPFINYLSLTPVHDANGSVTHYVGVQSDITELVQQRQAELSAKHAAVQAAAATEAKSQFLARMSHEIRTPLNGMIAVGQLLAETSLTPTQWDLVNTIRCSGEALLTLITDILDFSKIEANKMVLSRTPFFLESTIEAAMEIAGLQAARKRLQVAYHVAPGVPRLVVGDAQRLQQILLNILNNAIKFTESGEVLLEVWSGPVMEKDPGAHGVFSVDKVQLLPLETGTSRVPQPGSNDGVGSLHEPPGAPLSASQHQQPLEWEVHFRVRDTGIGIQPADLAHLFQSFSQVDASPTRRFGGSGLGLTISQKLSEAMGGRMWAASEGLGRGSTFRWCIRTEASAQNNQKEYPNERRRSRDEGILRGKKVLLIEQCAMVREVMMLSLRRWGCEVCCVDSEQAALAKLKRLHVVAGAAPGALPKSSIPANQATEDEEDKDKDTEEEKLPFVSMRPHTQTLGGCAAADSHSCMPTGTAGRHGRGHEPKRGLTLESLAHDELRAAHVVSNACSGPFDVVLMDVENTVVLRALIDECRREEARRIVFLGWPGQRNPESDDSENSSPRGTAGGTAAAAAGGTAPSTSTRDALTTSSTASASLGGTLPDDMPPPAYGFSSSMPSPPLPPLPLEIVEAVTEGGHRRVPGRRQLGFVVVSRPVRQGRLRLGLEEVLEMEVGLVGDAPDGGGGSGANTTNENENDNSKSGLRGSSSNNNNNNNETCPAGGAAAPTDPVALSLSINECATPDSLAARTVTTAGDHPACDSQSEISSSECSHTMRSVLSSSGSLLQAPFRKVGSSSNLAEGTALRDDTNATRRLLLAEDNVINMKVALGILRRLGFTNVVTAPDGEAAVAAVHAAGGPAAFFAILMDLHMPKKGGIEAVQDIIRLWPTQRTKIIAVTADAFEDTRDTCVANGFTGWLAKPFRVEEFARIMGQAT